jgi:hypothetical protein
MVSAFSGLIIYVAVDLILSEALCLTVYAAAFGPRLPVASGLKNVCCL